MSESKLRKIGNSLGIIIPKSIANEVNWNAGDDLTIEFNSSTRQLIITKKEASLYESEEFQNAVRDAVEKILQENRIKSDEG